MQVSLMRMARSCVAKAPLNIGDLGASRARLEAKAGMRVKSRKSRSFSLATASHFRAIESLMSLESIAALIDALAG